jgi:SsrA-binding protein
MAKKKQQPEKSGGVTLKNRRAFHEYHILEKVEAGLALTGTEVKSLRAGQAKIDEGYARVHGGEVFLYGMHIAPYKLADERMQHDPNRKRKLLLHRRQIRELEIRVQQKGLTLVPLRVYFTRGWAKCELGVAQGKQQHDKRQDLKKKQHQRDMQRELRGR